MPRRNRRPKPTQKASAAKKPSTRSAKYYDALASRITERKATQ